MTKIEKIYAGLCCNSVFSSLWSQPLFQAFSKYRQALAEENACDIYKAYAEFACVIYQAGGSLTQLVKRLVFEDENVYVKAVAKGETCAECIQRSTARELSVLTAFASLSSADFAKEMGVAQKDLPTFDSGFIDLASEYTARLKNIDKYGYGIFSSQGMFRLSDDKQIQPIASADAISLDSFIGYEEEREKIIENTRAFIEGRPAANALLCGDAGAGKSSTVKAVANAFFSEGVRLIEIRKDQLSFLPLVMSKIVGNPLKFIIFIDDLSFNRSDDHFSMLKAALEGSASATADNAIIYATSNRRHIIKESFSDREGDDVHRNDTLQEAISLSERFGLVVLFSKPNKALYLQIVGELAKKNGITIPEAELQTKAEAFALKKGNRSARCAEQFIRSLL